jgi:hypothetical protein
MTLDEKLLRATDGVLWRTKSGKLVRQRGGWSVAAGQLPKVRCFNTATSGFHGLLRLDRLEAP